MKLLVCFVIVVLLFVVMVFVYVVLLDGVCQLIVVISDGWDSIQGQLQVYVCDGKGWYVYGQVFLVVLGCIGSVWGLGLYLVQVDGLQKQEGDGCSLVGIFVFGIVFGYVVICFGIVMFY